MSSSEAENSDGGVPIENKRKRKSIVPPDEELEIDINLPEPPSKKAKRLEKRRLKSQKDGSSKGVSTSESTPSKKTKAVLSDDEDGTTKDTASTPAKRSDHGIWIGNLPWSATKDILKTFLVEKGLLEEAEITRIHMPAPEKSNNSGPNQPKIKPQNKGFAYVDFDSKDALDKALGLSETLLTGRKVLIKNAKSFEGRPTKSAAGGTATAAGEGGEGDVREKYGGKPPSKRIFVGNLDFTVTKDDLEKHFSQAGEIEDIHVATFEDSGKCKGYAWIRFVDLEAAEAAVRGFIFKINKEDEDMEEEGDEEGEQAEKVAEGSEVETAEKAPKTKKRKEKKKQKWFINRMYGRELRREFAEDAQTRYKKRHGKEGKDRRPAQVSSGIDTDAGGERDVAPAERPPRREQRPFKKRDARTIAPGQALANAPRNSAAIVAGSGTKVTFD